jgi:hypothetical protein
MNKAENVMVGTAAGHSKILQKRINEVESGDLSQEL